VGVDLVVVGRIRAVEAGRPMPPEDQADGYALGELEFEVEDVITGEVVEAEPRIIKVQFVLGDGRLLPRFTKMFPKERAVLFLANLGKHAERLGLPPDDPTMGFDHYSIQGPQGFVWDDHGYARPSSTDDQWMRDIEGRSFEEVIRDVRSIAAAASP
jgi:hypothetical protein